MMNDPMGNVGSINPDQVLHPSNQVNTFPAILTPGMGGMGGSFDTWDDGLMGSGGFDSFSINDFTGFWGALASAVGNYSGDLSESFNTAQISQIAADFGRHNFNGVITAALYNADFTNGAYVGNVPTVNVTDKGTFFPKGWGDANSFLNFGDTGANQGRFYPDGSAFFTNETQAYNYMWRNSNYGKSNAVENFAFITKNGVAVLPTHGVKANGQTFQNTSNGAPWDVYKFRGKGSTFAVDFNGTWIYPIASFHTHADSGYGADERPDGYDMGAFRTMGIPGFILGPDHFYGVGLSGTYSTYPASDLLKGNLLIIPNVGLFK